MLTTQTGRVSHHGWSLEVVHEEGEFYFECYAPDLQDFCNDGMAYSDHENALLAAFEFIDREIAIQALTEVVETWLESGQISETEYWNLTDFS